MLRELNTQKKPQSSIPDSSLPADLNPVTLSNNARHVLFRRYIRRGKDGQPVESVEEMFWRVAYHVAVSESKYGNDVLARAHQFYNLLSEKRFFPNSPTFTGAGTPLGQLAACFVLPVNDDMGRESAGIFQSLRDAALIQQTGGGNGFSFSRLRPKGTLVKASAGQATGPVGFMSVYDKAFGEIAQGGTRRGANMAVLRVDHPDIEDFISCKSNENAITNFNVSVGITDDFMEALLRDGMWDLRFPDVEAPEYKGFRGTLEQAETAGVPIRVYKTVRASELFDKIVRHAHNNGEPGVLFLDTANQSNPLPHLYQLEATNPCGEQWLGPYENCCLGSINLAQHLGVDNSVDWQKLRHSVELATVFLDDVVDANSYVDALPQLKQSALRARRIGLGIMGLGDLMYHAGIRYGSERGQEFASQVMEFVRYHAMLTSIELSKTRVPFPAIGGSIYDPNDFDWLPPEPLKPHKRNFGRPDLNWQFVTDSIRNYGIRNAAQTTIAPTGTIATVAGCEGYGCEPVFALAYIRHVDDNGKDLQLAYTSPLFEGALRKVGVDQDTSDAIINKVMERGSCQGLDDIPKNLQETFVVSSDISAEDHVRMQAALQSFVDNSLSKTINFPADATEEDVATAYKLAWELGCKGITVYITGSRKKVILETNRTARKNQDSKTKTIFSESKSTSMWTGTKKPRPSSLKGHTYSVETPLGKAFITINENGEDHPFEVFVNTAKAGSDTAAVSEAIGRMISYILRLASPIAPRDRMKEIRRQLTGIGGGRSLGFGPNRVRSLPDGVARVLAEYLKATETLESEKVTRSLEPDQDNGNKHVNEITVAVSQESPVQKDQVLYRVGDLCPDCGQAAVVYEEGCRKCYACGYSEC